MSKRAAIYVRVSSQAQAGDDKTSLETQEEDCQALAKKQGYEVVGVFKDVETGTNRKRPDFLKVVRMIETDEIDVLVAWAEDRLYRGFAVVPVYEAIQDKPDFTIEFVRGGFNRSMMAIMAGISQKELDDIRERTMRSRLANARQGKRQGGPVPYGYQKDDDGNVVPNPVEEMLLLRMFKLYADGATQNHVMTLVNAQGRKTRSGGRWARSTLTKIMSRAESYNSGIHPFKFGGEEHTVAYDPLLPDRLYALVAARQEAGRAFRKDTRMKHPVLCRRLLYDGCGQDRPWAMILAWRGSPAASVYRCNVHHHYPEGQEEKTHVGSVGVRRMDAFVWNAVAERYFDPERSGQAIDKEVQAIKAGLPDYKSELKRIKATLKKREKKEAAIVRLFTEDNITEKVMDQMLNELAASSTVAEQQQRNLIAKIKRAEGDLSWAKKVNAVLEDLLFKNVSLIADLTDLTVDEDGNVGGVVLGSPDPDTWIGSETLAQQLGAAHFRQELDLDWPDAIRYAQYVARKEIIDYFIERVNVQAGEPDESWIEWRELSAVAEVVLEFTVEPAVKVGREPSSKLD